MRHDMRSGPDNGRITNVWKCKRLMAETPLRKRPAKSYFNTFVLYGPGCVSAMKFCATTRAPSRFKWCLWSALKCAYARVLLNLYFIFWGKVWVFSLEITLSWCIVFDVRFRTFCSTIWRWLERENSSKAHIYRKNETSHVQSTNNSWTGSVNVNLEIQRISLKSLSDTNVLESNHIHTRTSRIRENKQTLLNKNITLRATRSRKLLTNSTWTTLDAWNRKNIPY